jgi:hypothetical protein
MHNEYGDLEKNGLYALYRFTRHWIYHFRLSPGFDDAAARSVASILHISGVTISGERG